METRTIHHDGRNSKIYVTPDLDAIGPESSSKNETKLALIRRRCFRKPIRCRAFFIEQDGQWTLFHSLAGVVIGIRTEAAPKKADRQRRILKPSRRIDDRASTGTLFAGVSYFSQA
jgi:hypothetical protein